MGRALSTKNLNSGLYDQHRAVCEPDDALGHAPHEQPVERGPAPVADDYRVRGHLARELYYRLVRVAAQDVALRCRALLFRNFDGVLDYGPGFVELFLRGPGRLRLRLAYLERCYMGRGHDRYHEDLAAHLPCYLCRRRDSRIPEPRAVVGRNDVLEIDDSLPGHDEHIAGRMAYDIRGHAAHQEPLQAFPAAPAHDYRVNLLVGRLLHYRLVGVPGLVHNGLAVDAGLFGPLLDRLYVEPGLF